MAETQEAVARFLFRPLEQGSLGEHVKAFVLKLQKGFGVFTEPVVETWPEVRKEYLRVVRRPMCLRDVLRGLDTSTGERLSCYMLVGEVVRDLLLIWSNCVLYNGADSTFGQLAAAFRAESLAQLALVARRVGGVDLRGHEDLVCRLVARHFPAGGRISYPEDMDVGGEQRVPTQKELYEFRQYVDALGELEYRALLAPLLEDAALDALDEELVLRFNRANVSVFFSLLEKARSMFVEGQRELLARRK